MRNVPTATYVTEGVRYFFTGGKGGVGKTTIAAAMAYDLATNSNKKTLLASLNPIHSLSNLLKQRLSGGSIIEVEGEKNLHAIEVEIDDLIRKYKDSIAGRLKEFFKWAEIPINPDPFIDIATTNPAFHESAMFDKVMDIVISEGQNYDAIVFDTAAVANAVRLIGLSKIYGLWLSRMLQSRKEALETRYKLSFRKDKMIQEIKQDPLVHELLNLNDKFKKARAVLTNPQETAFYFVTIPQSLPISVVKRFITMVKNFDIPVGGVIVNMVLKREAAAEDKSGYLSAKLEDQGKYLKMIDRDLGAYVRGYVPLYPKDIMGIQDVKTVVQDLGSFKPYQA